MESIISTFHIDWKILVAQLVNFGIVAFVLWWFALKPLMKLMAERTATIERGLHEAKAIAERSTAAAAEHEAILKEARVQAQQLIAQAEQSVAEKRAAALEKAKVEVQKVVDDGKASLAQERTTVLSEVRAHVADLVIAATTKVLAGSVDAKVDRAIVEQAVKDVGSQKK